MSSTTILRVATTMTLAFFFGSLGCAATSEPGDPRSTPEDEESVAEGGEDGQESVAESTQAVLNSQCVAYPSPGLPGEPLEWEWVCPPEEGGGGGEFEPGTDVECNEECVNGYESCIIEGRVYKVPCQEEVPAACAHGTCQTGGALVSGCDPCVTSVCQHDPYCCQSGWDSLCVAEVGQYCGASCSTAATCSHPAYTTGTKLGASCSSCTSAVCAADPYCCNTAWDSLCVSELSQYAALAHPICSTGTKLTACSSACVTSVCAGDPYCCNTAWDSLCVSEVSSICNVACP
jgi:hypothetical protein